MTTAVIVENFGGPQRPEEVESFLFNLFDDPDVIRMPFGRRLLARFISRRRAPKVIPEYERMGGGSPLVPTTLAQVAALEAELERRLPSDERPLLLPGMRYTPPFIAEAVERALSQGADRLIALPLFPHYSLTTTGSAHNAVARALAASARGREPALSYVPAFYDHPGYIAAVVARIREKLADAPDGAPEHLLFSAHGLPSSYIRRGDPYMRQVQEGVRLIVAALGWTGAWSLSWQSRVGPVKWLDPATDAVLARLAEVEGVRSVLVVPISFVSDHIETLVELGHTYRQLAISRGMTWFEVTWGLDDQPDFIACLADLVEWAMAGAYERTCFRCLLPRDLEHLSAKRCPDCRVVRPYYEQDWRARRRDAGGATGSPRR